MEGPAPAGPRGPWSRRWFRRLTYVIVAGGALAGLAGYLAQRPEVDRWLVAQLDRYARREFGLGVGAERLEFHPFEGRILVHGLTVGGDLLQARRLEVDLEWASLLHTPHLRQVVLDEPVVVLDRARLARIRLRPRPPGSAPAKVRLDRLELRSGRVSVREPAWGLPRGDFRFQVTGRGRSANQLQVQVQVPAMVVGTDPDPWHGQADLAALVTDHRVDVQRGQVRLGDNRLAFRGGYGYASQTVSLVADGHLDLVQVQRLAQPGRPAAASGQVDFQARAEGRLDALAWSGTLTGRGLRARNLPIQPGTLQVAAQGDPRTLRVDRLAWASPDGRLDATGTWTARGGTRLQTTVRTVPLAPAAARVRADFLKNLSVSLTGEARMPPGPGGAPWSFPGLEHLTFRGKGEFHQAGQQVGGLQVALEGLRFQVPAVDLTLPELAFHGSAQGTLDRRGGLAAAQAEATLGSDAANVASMLLAWNIGMETAPGRMGPLDMAGATQVEARVGWEPRTGIQLAGQVQVQEPRWHGARADRLQASVSIDRDVLRVSDIQLAKGDGRGTGDLWLTWATLPKGSEQIDMTYRADQLPVREGLKAADLGDLQLDGTGSGWVRLHGPFDRILMEGQAQAVDGRVYGLKVPAVSADFAMDIAGDRLQATRVRVADAPEHLGQGDPAPTGPLALQGALDLDTRHETWDVTLAGDLDTGILGLPGPRFQGRVDTHLEGPLTAPLGPTRIPQGQITFTAGRMTQGDQTLDGLEASAAFTAGRLTLRAGLAGKALDLVRLEALQQAKDRVTGSLEVDVGPQSADTAQLATRLTGGFLKDAHLRVSAQGGWGPDGLRWQGRLDRFYGQFEGFHLVQAQPGTCSGDLDGMRLDLALEGRTPVAPGEAAPVQETATYPLQVRGAQRRPVVSATRMNLDGRVPFSRTGALALKLAGSSDLANLKTLLDRVVQPGQYSLLADLHPEGSAEFDLDLGGTFADTTLDGHLTLKGGQAVVHGSPLSLDNLGFTAQFHGRDILIPRTDPLRATIAQGALSAWGQATWSLGGFTSYDLHASLEDFQLRDLPTGFEMLGSLDANLKGSDRNGGLLTGSIWARRAFYRTEINLGDLILASAFGTGSGLSSLDPSDPLARIDLDLEVHLAEPWELDTNLLKLQGRTRGPFWVRGSLARPGLQGRMELLPGGRVTNLFPAGDVILERGTVEFQDPTTFNPILDIQGQIDISPYLVSLDISGALDSLNARPYSTPSLRQDEIFAILIDPSAVNTVGGAPGSSTAQTAVSTGLASTGSGLLTSLALANFQEQLRRSLNLDRVNVALRTGVGAPETSITVGKTIDLLGYHTPLVFTHDKAGDVTTISGQVEWRFGNFVFRLGASQSTSDSLAPSGEIRHSWSPR